ncbi:hypothetical protein Acsp03_32070 [Actinomadura sp. NBRC 104412]|uniref:hypothetical protein n=1 Tax=Actinomadura sp. NBRC 104412 TaxID=3032203 RepID=UPI0024A147CF|nr:hypothetical protein [Actinomadura sp. NBRC 104412]GLZ05741.1 hypothetical protein Acsp03_32070 [Actinomadura sp. NBRC 104412]
MIDSVAKPAGALAICGALLASSGCGLATDLRYSADPCGRISHELGSLEKKSLGHSRYSADHAKAFRNAASEIRAAAKDIDGSSWSRDPQYGRRAANEIAAELDQMAAKLSALPPGGRAVYISPGSKKQDLPSALLDACGIPTDDL